MSNHLDDFMEKNVEKVKKNENKVTCKDCGISYDNETILEGHIERKHLKIGRRRKLKCKECKKSVHLVKISRINQNYWRLTLLLFQS